MYNFSPFFVLLYHSTEINIYLKFNDINKLMDTSL